MMKVAKVHADAVQQCLLLALDRLVDGVAVVDGTSRLRFSNAAARSILQRRGWTDSTDRVSLPAPADERAWLRSLHEVCLRQRHTLTELGADSREPVFVALAPLAVNDEVLAVATFQREALCGPVELQLFSRVHGLTLAENQVLQALCQGERPADIARKNGVARSTVLTQVAAIRSKTQRRSVSELLQTLSRLPAVRPLGLTG